MDSCTVDSRVCWHGHEGLRPFQVSYIKRAVLCARDEEGIYVEPPQPRDIISKMAFSTVRDLTRVILGWSALRAASSSEEEVIESLASHPVFEPGLSLKEISARCDAYIK